MRIRALGGARAEVDGEALVVDTRKATALLVYLAVTDVPQRRDALAALLWPTQEQAKARSSLRRTVSVLRKALDGRTLVVEGDELRLETGDLWCDAVELQRAAEETAGHDHGATAGCVSCADRLGAAAALIKGRFLAGFGLRDAEPFERWQLSEDAHLDSTATTIYERLVAHLGALGRHDEVIERARQWAKAYPLDEAAHRALMRALAPERPEEALAQFDTCAAALRDELAVEPSPETAALRDDIAAGKLSRRRGAPPDGVVTFVFTDVEGSTRLARAAGDRWVGILDQHNSLMREAIDAHDGFEVKTEGDAFFVAFADAANAIRFCVDAQRSLARHEWPSDCEIRVRMGMHTGAAHVIGDDYVGLAVHEAARIGSSSHGGQIVLSAATANAAGEIGGGVSMVDLGLHALKDFPEPQSLYEVAHPELRSGFPPLRTLTPSKGNLPQPPHDLIGRSDELEAALDVLASGARMLTLTGPGGIGKTRLAIEVARAAQPGLSGGAWFVALAPLTDDTFVLQALADALSVTQRAGETLLESVAAVLGTGPSLVVFDNAEHLPSSATVARELIEVCASVQVLVTSRVRLRLRHEHELRLNPVGEPDAVRLFEARAAAARPGFAVDDSNADDVAELCRALDGIPLAIELAAARVRLFGPAALVERIRRDIGILGGGAIDLPEHQRTLRGAIAWSYDLLDDATRHVLQRLAVFRGGARLDALEAVCDGVDSLTAAEELVDHNLVTIGEDPDGEPRFGSLETIRQFAAERLADSGTQPDAERRHAEWFCEWIERVEPELIGPDQLKWYAMLDAEHENLRAAIDRLGGDRALAVAASLARYWARRGRWAEGKEVLERLLASERDDVSPRTLGRALLGLGYIELLSGEAVVAERHLKAALEHASAAGDTVTEIRSLVQMAEALRAQNELEPADDFAARAAEAAMLAGDDRERAWALNTRALCALAAKQLDQANGFLHEALRLHSDRGDERGVATCLMSLGNVALRGGQLARAQDFFEQALSVNRRLNALDGIALALTNLGDVAFREERDAAAESLYAEALSTYVAAGHRLRVARLQLQLGGVAREQGHLDVAKLRYSEAEMSFRSLGLTNDLALVLLHAADLAAAMGETARAREYFEESIRVATASGAEAVAAEAGSLLEQLLAEAPAAPQPGTITA